MSTPEKSATHGDAAQPDHEVTFAEKVGAIVSDMVKTDNGTWMLPEGDHSEEIKYAAMAEKRRRDSQSAYTKVKQDNVSLQSQRDAYKAELVKAPTLKLSSEQREELDTLKHSDPDKWREQLGNYESEALVAQTAIVEAAGKQATADTEVARRQAALDAFVQENPDFVLNDEDIPPRISNKLAKGDVTFEEFLSEVHNYLGTPKTIVPKVADKTQPNLGNVAGSDTPTEGARFADMAKDYATTDIF